MHPRVVALFLAELNLASQRDVVPAEIAVAYERGIAPAG